MTSHVLVTGGAGFIGSYLTHWLVAHGHHVRVLDNLSTGRWQNLDSVRGSIELVEGDIQDDTLVRQSMEGIDVAVHLAAMVSVTQSVKEPLRAHAMNTTGTMHVLESAREVGVRRVIQASSCAIYGDPMHLPIGEDSPLAPLSPYAATKLAAEQLGQLYTRLYGLETVALRFFNVYGPRQDPTSPYAAAVARFIAAVQAQQAPTVYGDGRQTRDFIFVGDVVRAISTAVTAPGISGGVFNVGSGVACSISDLVRILSDVLEVDIAPQFAPARSCEVRHSLAEVRRFAARSGFRAAVGLREGLTVTARGAPATSATSWPRRGR